MPNRTPPTPLDLALAKARQLLAAGRREEAMALALALLKQELGCLRYNLLALQNNLARLRDVHDQASSQPEKGQGDNPVRPPNGGGYYH
jgi:thioredoxin-like negative regulator of GroEL